MWHFLFDLQNDIAIWNKKQIRVYELICDASKSDEEKVVRNEKGKQTFEIYYAIMIIFKGSFSCSPSNVVLFDQLIFVLENGRVNVMSFQVRIFPIKDDLFCFGK
jgi:hypothetical protein